MSPEDWAAPVDYRNGPVYVRVEPLEKPAGDQPTSWSVCYMPNKGRNHDYGCISIGANKTAGVHEKDRDMITFW